MYQTVNNKSVTELRQELLRVFLSYPEYSDNGFPAMVEKFAGDNFYNLHFVAKEYLVKTAES